MLGGMDAVRVDVRNTPIMDYHDMGSNAQIMHKFIIKTNPTSTTTPINSKSL